MDQKDYFSQDILEDALSEKQKERRQKRAELKTKKEIAAEKKLAAEENRKKRRKFLLMAVAALVIIAAIFGNSFYQIYQLSKEKEAAEKRLLEINYTIGRLEDELSRIKSPEYIEQQARNQLRMIYPGERLYIILNSHDK